MKIIQKRQRHTEVSYTHQFDYIDSPGSGFSFPCDKDGEVLSMQPAARANYMKCLSGEHKVRDLGIQRREHTYTEPTIGECNECGAEVVLSGFTNTCDCGCDYNMSGQMLAPRECWGEETGESLSDILSIA